MAKQIQAIRGMNDCLPEQSPVWQKVEQILRQVVASYGYSEVRMPIVEQTHLFKRAIGEVTDVVEKEMYTFEDRNGDSLSLRPEGTASCVRAGIEHGLLYNQERRMWYMGPMFRHERPQKGRYRQFHQFGVELFGINGPDIDAELIMLTHRLWRLFGISDHVTLQLNTLGQSAERAAYRDALGRFFDESPSPQGLAGFIAARYTAEVLSGITGPITRATVLAALQRRADVNMGGYVVAYRGKKRTNAYVTQSMLTQDGRIIG